MAHSNASHRQASRDALRAPEAEAGPTLSVILVSLGTRQELERAVRVVAPTIETLQAQLIVVRRSPEPTLEFALAELGRVEIVRAADDTARSDMLALAMRAAHGDIIAVRDDTSVKDAQWLAGYQRALAARASSPSVSHPADEPRPDAPSSR
jgi:hypothetical protein